MESGELHDQSFSSAPSAPPSSFSSSCSSPPCCCRCLRNRPFSPPLDLLLASAPRVLALATSTSLSTSSPTSLNASFSLVVDPPSSRVRVAPPRRFVDLLAGVLAAVLWELSVSELGSNPFCCWSKLVVGTKDHVWGPFMERGSSGRLLLMSSCDPGAKRRAGSERL